MLLRIFGSTSFLRLGNGLKGKFRHMRFALIFKRKRNTIIVDFQAINRLNLIVVNLLKYSMTS